MLASDDLNQEFADASNPDRVLHVQFYTQPVQDNFQSKLQGAAIFRDETFVRIMIPGRSDLTIDEPVEERHKARFPRQWAHFKNMTADTELIVGTPVTEWPAVTRAQAEELRAKKFYSVQQIAECSDAQIQALGMNGSQLRAKARAFVESAKGTAIAQAQAEEIARKDAEIDALRNAQAATSQQLAELMALVKGGKQAKPGRKPMSEEARKAAGARLKAAREAKAQQQAQQPPAE